MHRIPRKALFLGLLLGFFGAPNLSQAAYYYIEPTTISAKRGDIFEVLIKLQTEGESVYTADIQLEFDPSVLGSARVTQMTEKEAFFPSLIQKLYSSYVYMGSYIAPPPSGKPKSGDGSIAKVSFKVIKEESTQLKFRCSPGKANDSNVTSRKNGLATDVIDCTKNQGAMVNSASPTSPTPSPTAVPTPTAASTPTPTITATPIPTAQATQAPTQAPQATPTPSVLPETGIIQTTGIVIMLGVGLAIVSLLVKLYVS